MADTPNSAQDLKGRVKEAAGDVTKDDKLKREGKIEQAGDKVKQGVDQATEKVKDVLHRD